MRDVLTYLAGLVIVVLTAALAIPPLVDWRPYRASIDGAIGRATGLQAQSDGRLEIRLLPTPRLRMDHLRLASPGSDPLSLDAMRIRAEIELTPLLSGEIRFRDTRIERADFKLPVGTGGDWRIPRAVFDDAARRRAFVFEDLAIRQLLLTTFEPGTGRTDQLYAEGVRIAASSLIGPFRIDGDLGGERFEVSTGQVGSDLAAQVKIGAGAEGRPRLDFDGKVELRPGADDTLTPFWSGQAKLVQPQARPRPPDGPLAVSAQANVKASGRSVELDAVAIELGEGAGVLRLTGAGRYRVDDALLSLELEGRRFNLAALLAGLGEAPALRLAALRARQPRQVDLSLKLDGVAIGADDDLTGLTLDARLAGETATLRMLEFGAPGQARVNLSGELSLANGGSGQGTVRLSARESDRFGRFLDGLHPNPATRLLDGQPLSLVAAFSFGPPILSFRELRITQGDTVVSGLLRYAMPDAGERGRLDAQLALRGLDLSRLPDGGLAFEAARSVDFGIALDAREIAYGTSRSGRIAARFSTESGAIRVDALEVSDLAGAHANLSGRITPDGAGRIAGRMKAARAAPLVDLFGRAWLGGMVRLLPDAVREGAVDAGVSLEREAATGGPAGALRSLLEGTLAGGPARVAIVSTDRVQTLEARLATDRADTWLGLPIPALAKPARIEITGGRDGAGRLALAVKGIAAGLSIETSRPLTLGPDDDRLDAAEMTVTSADLRPFAGLWCDGPAQSDPLPLAAKVTLVRDDASRYRVDGRIADTTVKGDVSVAPSGEIGGTAEVSSLSLPWLASALSLRAPPAAAGAIWAGGRFGPSPPRMVLGSLKLAAASLALGPLNGRDASFILTTSADGFALRDLAFALGDGRITGTSLTVNRQGGLASLIGEGTAERLPLALFAGPPMAGRISGNLRFGASGESVAGLVANLGGAGTAVLEGLTIAAASPAGVERAATRALASDDPLAGQRLQPLLARELDAGSLAAERVATNVSLVGGTLRMTPLRIDAPDGSWQGAASIDLRTRAIEARGALQAATAPKRWASSLPYVTLGWEGPLARPVRTIDPGPLVSGLASAVLQRELERIEIFELDAAERGRLNARVDMDKKRREAAEEVVRQARLREEAAERARVEAERRRVEAERAARAVGERNTTDAPGPPSRPLPDAPPPVPVRPPFETRPAPTSPGG